MPQAKIVKDGFKGTFNQEYTTYYLYKKTITCFHGNNMIIKLLYVRHKILRIMIRHT